MCASTYNNIYLQVQDNMLLDDYLPSGVSEHVIDGTGHPNSH